MKGEMRRRRIICAECEHVRLLEHWTQRHTALRCENPACGEWYGRVVEICPVGMDIRARVLEAPVWCVRRRSERLHQSAAPTAPSERLPQSAAPTAPSEREPIASLREGGGPAGGGAGRSDKK